MNHRSQGIACWIVGLTVANAALGNTFLWLTKPSMKIPLLASAAILCVVGGYLLLTTRAPRSVPAPGSTSASEHHRPSRVGWVFVVPFLLLPFALVGPLNSASAKNAQVVPASATRQFTPLPADPVVQLSVSDFLVRASYDETDSMAGRRIRLIGFATPTQEAPGWVLTRYVMTCCAADANAVKVIPVGAAPLAADTWVAVEGEWIPSTAPPEQRAVELPQIRVSSLEVIRRPELPYE